MPVKTLIGRANSLLPASSARRGIEFERLARTALFCTKTAIPRMPSISVRGSRPGQWDGLIEINGNLMVFEAKAYSAPMATIPKLDLRIAEAKRAGIRGVAIVSLSGFCDIEALARHYNETVFIDFSNMRLASEGEVLLSTGDMLSADGEGFRLNNGFVLISSLPIKGFNGNTALVEDEHFTALRRAAMYAAMGRCVSLYSVPPFKAPENEVERLWHIEDMISGLYSPPLKTIKRIIGDWKPSILKELPQRLAANLHKIATHGGSQSLPDTPSELTERILQFPPFAYWSQMSAGRDFAATREAISSAYQSYAPYSINLFNPNKSRACDRYINAAKCKE